MTTIAFGRRMQCDVCLKQADMLGPYDQEHAYLDEPVPPGWTSMRAVTAATYVRLELKEMFGRFISHLCDECSALPVGQLVAKMSGIVATSMRAEKEAREHAGRPAG